jgi:hypothetical protein
VLFQSGINGKALWSIAGATGSSESVQSKVSRKNELNIARILLMDESFLANQTVYQGQNLWHIAAQRNDLSVAMLMSKLRRRKKPRGSLPM